MTSSLEAEIGLFVHEYCKVLSKTKDLRNVVRLLELGVGLVVEGSLSHADHKLQEEVKRIDSELFASTERLASASKDYSEAQVCPVGDNENGCGDTTTKGLLRDAFYNGSAFQEFGQVIFSGEFGDEKQIH